MLRVAKDKHKANAKAFGRRLHALRKERGMTQAKLGEAAGGMIVAAVSRLENGGRTPSWDTVLALAAALGVTPDAFLDGGDDEPAKKKKKK